MITHKYGIYRVYSMYIMELFRVCTRGSKKLDKHTVQVIKNLITKNLADCDELR